MINVGVNSKDAENSLASLEETLKNISSTNSKKTFILRKKFL